MRGGWCVCFRLTLTPVSNVSNMREVQERSGARLLACTLFWALLHLSEPDMQHQLATYLSADAG